ncbi:MAG TPA: sigma-70 family RNA polymerase sigma factor [Candidatus Binatia bacterium]|nr:sigma-70 family RNA polymerase sigma factor [Candidatus Binatia bacterium]
MTAESNAAVAQTPDEDLGTLIALCSAGDSSALARLYDRTAAQVNGLALRILSDREAAEEITIDVYLQAWRSAASYDAERGSPLAWLLTLARSRAIDRLRGTAAQRRVTDSLDHATSIPSSEPGPEGTSATSQRRRIVQAALARLGPTQRQAIELAFYGGLSHSEIAAALGQPLGTIKTRVRLGMLRLRDILGTAGREAL